MNYLNGQYRSETLRYTLRDGQLRVVTTPQHRGYDAQFTVTIRVVEGSHPVNQIFLMAKSWTWYAKTGAWRVRRFAFNRMGPC